MNSSKTGETEKLIGLIILHMKIVNWFIYTFRSTGKSAQLIAFFLHDQRPQEWNQWAEVVWKDYRIPRYIGICRTPGLAAILSMQSGRCLFMK